MFFMRVFLLVSTVTILILTNGVKGHGRMIDPVSRSTAWRQGFNVPENMEDNSLFCGGWAVSKYLLTVYYTRT